MTPDWQDPVDPGIPALCPNVVFRSKRSSISDGDISDGDISDGYISEGDV